MDPANYHVIYVDNRMSRDLDGKYLQKEGSAPTPLPDQENQEKDDPDAPHIRPEWESSNSESAKAILGEIEEIRTNLRRILTHFNGVHTCTSSRTCMANLRRLDTASSDNIPIIVLSSTNLDRKTAVQIDNVARSPTADSPYDTDGLALLQHLSANITTGKLSKLVIPIALLYTTHPSLTTNRHSTLARAISPWPASSTSIPQFGADDVSALPNFMSTTQHVPDALTCIDAGAIDVLTSPIEEPRLQSLLVRGYRTHQEAVSERAEDAARKRSRKLSWLGNTQNRPYAYLREKMVSELMTGICNPDEHIHSFDHKSLHKLDAAREAHLKSSLGSWAYSGHEYNADELVHAARFMLQHALSVPGVEQWHLSPSKLTTFVLASRAAYNDFVDYHNFRHVIDVMQAIFFFLIQLGVLPPFTNAPMDASNTHIPHSPIAELLGPADALTLLITAIGHDVGHPGVNNAFLVALNAPLAQLYNDKSVLEAFHCAAYSQILRRYWRSTFEDVSLRSLMINSILATDMGVHQKYMTDAGNLQEKLHHNQGTDGFTPQQLDDYRVLTCALLIKCADISNVARPYAIAVRWANILQLEFANQGMMERDVGIPTTLFGGPPELGNLVKLGQSQNSFMNFFAQPLFEAVTDVLPPMVFAVDEIKRNQAIWTEKIAVETEQLARTPRKRDYSTGHISPLSTSPHRPNNQPPLMHPEGLPASGSSPEHPSTSSQPQSVDTNQSTRSGDTSANHPLSSLDSNALNQGSRRSSRDTNSHHGVQAQHTNLSSDAATEFSRRSSGALSANGLSHGTIIERRTSNGSYSQTQVGLSPKSFMSPCDIGSENQQIDGRGSEDTLSHISYLQNASPVRRGISAGDDLAIVGASTTVRRSSQGSDYQRSNGQTIPQSSSSRPLNHAGHHRTSSGARTNTTNISLSAPYSPTGTQATSVITTESDEKTSPQRLDNWNPSGGFADSPDFQPTNTAPRYGNFSKIDTGNHKNSEVKSMAHTNGHTRDSSSIGSRSIGKKSSRFNIFHSWKRKSSGRIDASP